MDVVEPEVFLERAREGGARVGRVGGVYGAGLMLCDDELGVDAGSRKDLDQFLQEGVG